MPAVSGAVTLGIGGINPGGLQSPLFTSLHVREARTGVSWDAAVKRNPSERRQLAAWLAAAQAAGVTPLVSFAGDGNHVPSVREYSRAVTAFIKMFPSVTRYTPWNEPDWPYRSLSRHPLLAAAYFNTLRASCRRCVVLAGDVFLQAEQLSPWVRAYIKGLHSRPAGWALHNYRDVRTHDTQQLRALLKLTHGPVWLDETAGVLRRGHWPYPNQSAKAAAADERYLLSLPRRFPRVSRIYHYEWQGVSTAGWDSGLISAAGKPRPAYYAFASAVAK
jgi:hypothetical protein